MFNDVTYFMHGEIIIQNLQFQRINIMNMKITITIFTQKIDGTVLWS